MPGLCGIVGNGAVADLSSYLADMLSRMKHHSWYVVNQHVDCAGPLAFGRVSLGFVNRADQPATNEDQSLLGMMGGEVYDYEDHRHALAASRHEIRSTSHAELLLHGYEQDGRAFLRKVHGTFVAAIWDSAHRRLMLACDRFGMKPLYYAKLPGKLLFASEIKAILSDPDVSRNGHLRGIAQFFTFGQLLGEDTLLEAIHFLPAAGWLTYDIDADRLTVERYWQPTVVPIDPRLSREAVLDRVHARLSQSVNRCVRDSEKLGISLSGGLDSRTILALIDHQQVSLQSVSMGVEGCLDHRCAEQMAAHANRRHHSYVLNAEFLADYEDHMKWMVHLTDGQYLCSCIVMPTLPFYRELDIEVLLRGHAGELMHMDKAYQFSLNKGDLTIRDDASLEAWLYRHLCAEIVPNTGGPLFAAGYHLHVAGLVRDSVRSCLQECVPVDPPIQRVWQLFVNQRSRRETGLSMVEFNSLVETRLPFLDADLVELLLSMPPELKLGDTIQAHILRRQKPAFLDIVNANTGSRMRAGPWQRLFGKARLKIFSKLGVPGYQPYERMGLWLRRELQPLVEKLLLNDRCLDRGLFNPQTLRAVVQHHFKGQQNHTDLILALMIFELGQREFVDNDKSSEPVIAAPRTLNDRA